MSIFDSPAKLLILGLIYLFGLFVANLGLAQKTGEVDRRKISWPLFSLQAEHFWRLSPPRDERFDASGLLLQKNGDLLTVNDRGASLYRVDFPSDSSNEALLTALPECFTATQLASISTGKAGRWDCEGIAKDDQQRLYLCEEGNRWILRFDPKAKKVERLEIDWSPGEKYFHKSDRNASFEGIAIGDGKLFVANERQTGRIIVLDLRTLKVIDDFTVRPANINLPDTHYSDLCWFDGALWALLRENGVVVKIDPKARVILAEYKFGKLENVPDLDYEKIYPSSLFEGLAMDEKFIWLVTDNNGQPRKNSGKDIRPTLVRCLRPDIKK